MSDVLEWIRCISCSQLRSGNILIVGSTTAAIIGLTWGGVIFSWSSPRVLVPLIVGFVGLGIMIVYEAYIPREPTVSVIGLPAVDPTSLTQSLQIPIWLLSNRTSLSGYIQTALVQCIIVSYVCTHPMNLVHFGF